MARYSHRVGELLDERELFQEIAALHTQYIATITRAATSRSLCFGQEDENES